VKNNPAIKPIQTFALIFFISAIPTSQQRKSSNGYFPAHQERLHVRSRTMFGFLRSCLVQGSLKVHHLRGEVLLEGTSKGQVT
jgi:hypothetical protein